MDTPGRAQREAEGSAVELWQGTMGRIPTSFGRLVYLASLRDQTTDRYMHHGLSQVFGQEESDRTLRQSHEQTFADWLCFDLERQKDDLDRYLSGFHLEKRSVLATWIRLAPYRNLTPTTIQDPERRVYLADIEAALELLSKENAAGAPDPDA